MFAYDVARFSDTIISLKHQVNYIENICLTVGMHLNLLKTKIINKQKNVFFERSCTCGSVL